MQGPEKVRVVFAHGFKQVACKFAMMRALLDKDEIVDLAKLFPDFGKLSGQQLPEDRTNAHICEIISTAPNRAPSGGIVSVLGMIKRLSHEPGKGLGAARPNYFANELDEFSLQPENV